MKKFILLFAILAFTSHAWCQIGFIQVIDSLDKRLSEDELKRFAKADKLFKSGDDLINVLSKKGEEIRIEEEKIAQAEKRREKRKAKKNVKKLKEAAIVDIYKVASLYSDAFRIKFTILNEKINYFYSDKVPDAQKAQILQHEAKQHHTTANAKINPLKETKDYHEAAQMLYEILEFRAVAMDKQMMALCYFINCLSIESNFDGILFICEQLLSPEQKPKMEKLKKEIEPDKTKVIAKIEPITKTEPEEKGFETVENTPKIVETPKCADLQFRIQIIAVSKQISQKKLLYYYPKGKTEKIDELRDKDGLWKYRVRYFTNYDEAKAFNDNTKVTDSFVIALCNGEQIRLTDAIEMSKKK